MNNPYGQKPIVNPNGLYKKPVNNVTTIKPKKENEEIKKVEVADKVGVTDSAVITEPYDGHPIISVDPPTGVTPGDKIKVDTPVIEEYNDIKGNLAELGELDDGIDISDIHVVGMAYEEDTPINECEVLFNLPNGQHCTLPVGQFNLRFGGLKDSLSPEDWERWEEHFEKMSAIEAEQIKREFLKNTVNELNERKKEKIDRVQDVTQLSPSEALEEIARAAAEEAEGNEDIQHIRDIQHAEYADRDPSEVAPEDGKEVKPGLTEVERTFPTDATGKPIFTNAGIDPVPAADVNIFEADRLEEIQDQKFSEALTGVVGKKNPDLSDEETMQLLDVLMAYRKNKDINVYGKLPQKMRSQVMQIAMSSGVTPDVRVCGKIAKMMMDEMILETAQDQTFIDFEKSLKEAMKIPSLMDIYQEGVSESISEKIPEMADAIEKEDPEKARMLRQVSAAYQNSISLQPLYDRYNEDSRTRKLMRRDWQNWNRFADEINFWNADTQFRINDARSIQPALVKTIVHDPENDVTEEEICKFIVLLNRTLLEYDPKEIVDAAYIYYCIKNLSMLAYVDPAKTTSADSFSAELISNIKVLIYYIRSKEAQNNVVNDQPSNKKLKRSQRDKLKKQRR